MVVLLHYRNQLLHLTRTKTAEPFITAPSPPQMNSLQQHQKYSYEGKIDTYDTTKEFALLQKSAICV